MALDLSTDYLLFDGLETFTLKQGTSAAVPVNNCLRQGLSSRDMAFSATVGLTPDDLIINLWAPELGGLVPEEQNVLADAGGVGYTIINVAYRSLIGRYRCIARKQLRA